tara:strand:- start:51 stop:734 length:684 start_codon:yes stop_codon:yes gene_type:complete
MCKLLLEGRHRTTHSLNMKDRTKYSHNFATPEQRGNGSSAALPECEWLHCTETGDYEAPHSRDKLDSSRWFCLKHVREYNKTWNYYTGMSDKEVEDDIRCDTVWNRPTWHSGVTLGANFFKRVQDPFFIYSELEGRHQNSFRKNSTRGNLHNENGLYTISTEEKRAYRILGLEHPVTLDQLKTRYKSLVKEHHPDANDRAKHSDEHIKLINESYSILRVHIENNKYK